jgi:hypothetical protein
MNRYPRLSDEAYEDPKIHREEVIEAVADAVADVVSYYDHPLSDGQLTELKKALASIIPEKS